MKTRLAIAALVTMELACAPFAAEAKTDQISTTQKTHYNSMTASKMYPTSVFNPPGLVIRQASSTHRRLVIRQASSIGNLSDKLDRFPDNSEG
jgi:hypothetical protein